MCTRLTVAILALAASPLAAQNCVDQFYFPITGNGLEITSNQSVEQTFLVQLTGQLLAVELYELRHHRGISTFDLRFDLYPLNGNGAPSGESVATVIIPPSALTSVGVAYSVDLFSQHVLVTAGERYAIHLETLSPSNGATYAWAGDAPGGYANGDCWIRTNVGPLSYDMGFATRVLKNPSLLLDLSQPDGPRSLRIAQQGGIPGDFYILALSFDPRNAPPSYGLGPWAGLHISTNELIGELEVGFPFVGTFDAQGNASVSFQAPIVPAFVVGQTLWGVTRDLSPALGFRSSSPVEGVRLR
ncbi:MAG: hypothetical protein IPN34_16010 [Planctomycetes bacterium]|nr:hypothetical protein [Planctomycetota bacterium]